MPTKCYFTEYSSPIGILTLASDGDALVGLWIEGQKHFAEGFIAESPNRHLPIFDATTRWLDVYFSGHKPDFMPHIRLIGTDFRKRVWQSLMGIPYGKTTTYGDISREIVAGRSSKQMSAQAVGSAVGHNPISIIVPCHRVVGSDESLTGYAAGISKKLALLRLESNNLAQDQKTSYCIQK